MKTINDDFSRDRKVELALAKQLIINRESFIEKLLNSLNIESLSEDDFQFLVTFLKDFENNQSKIIQAYHHEKTLNDNYFNGLYE